MSVPLGVMDPEQRLARPAYVRFSRRSREDRNASIQSGHVVELHEDIVHINPPGSRDCVERDVKGWFENLQGQLRDRMISPATVQYYKDTYARWRDGNEMPPVGTPILGWQLLSSTEQQRVIGCNILTVEDLAEASYEHLQAIGMGSMSMQTKAKNWIAVGQDKGAVALQVQALEEKNAELTRKVEELLAAQAAQPQPKRRGRPPKAAMIAIDEMLGADD